MPFDNSLKNMQTPGRVHALCKLLLLDSYTPERLLELLQPDSPDKEQAKSVYKLALNGGLIRLSEDKKTIHLQVSNEDVINPKKFEQHIAKLAFTNTKYIFGRFAGWMMARVERVISATKEDISEQYFKEVSSKTTSNREFNPTNILAWFTWANYFGLGHTMDGKFVGNPAKRIQRVLENPKALKNGEYMPFREFMKWLGENCPELDGGKWNTEFNEQFPNQQLSFALSLGLRTLHDIGVIHMIITRDVEDIWYLQDVPAHEIQNQVTDIMVKG